VRESVVVVVVVVVVVALLFCPTTKIKKQNLLKSAYFYALCSKFA
jgi:hypothetical protein